MRYIVVILCGIALYYIIFSISYFSSERKAEKSGFKRWYNNEYKPLDFKGTIYSIDDGNAVSNCDFLLTILSDKMISFDLSSCKSDSFRTYIQKGDSIIKKANDLKVRVFKNGKAKEFVLPFTSMPDESHSIY